MKRALLRLVMVSAFGAALSSEISAQEWPRFRGPNGSGVSQAKTIPTQWSARDYNWQLDLPGIGHSSPVLWGKLLVVTSGIEEDGTRIVLGIDADSGSQRWRRDFPGATHRKHKLNSFASATPAIDERQVYVCWSTPESFLVIALDHDGQEVWRTDLGPFRAGHGDGVSPIVHDGVVVLAKEHEGQSEIVALDCWSGAVRWRVPRQSRSTWATPCIFHSADGPPELILVSYEHGVSSLDPTTGAVNWETDVFDKGHVESTIASPVIAGDLILGSSGWLAVRQEVVAVRPRRQLPTLDAPQVYCIDRGVPLCTTPLVVEDLLFLWADEGIVTCADVASGKVHWSQRVGGTYYASPIVAGDHVYNVSADGEVVVFAAERRGRLVGRSSLGESSHSTPAVANGTMYLRTFSKLFSLGGAQE